MRLHLVAWLAAALLFLAPASVRTQSVPDAITDQDFWRLTTALSEPGGRFAQQLMSNEDSQAFVIPALKEKIRPGGVYLGVGEELNFTYLAALQPRIAFIVDIRSDNLLELLMYKALFDLSADRTTFVSRLFSRPRPARLRNSSTVTELFEAYSTVSSDAALLGQTADDVLTNLTGTHRFSLSQPDQTTITGMLATFQRLGPGGVKGYGDRTNLGYAQMMSVTDLEGRLHGFLASEENYRAVRSLEQRNLIIGVTGDFAGTKALAGIARELRTQNLNVSVFYVSNVERYLFEQGDHGRQFYKNVAALPLDPAAVFIRTATRDISDRLGIPVPPGSTAWWTYLFSIRDCLAGLEAGRIQTYKDLFTSPL